MGSIDFAMKLLEEAEVAVSPGRGFGERAKAICAWPWWRTSSGCGRRCGRSAAACGKKVTCSTALRVNLWG